MMSGTSAKRDLGTGDQSASSVRTHSRESAHKHKEESSSYVKSHRMGDKKKKTRKVVYYETDSSSPSTSGSESASTTSKKQTYVALSTAEAKYVVTGQCCAQLLWMRQTLRDFGYNLSKVPLLCDNESVIRLADNPIEHNHTKHIDIRHHFLRDH
jgi:hypothetical protein